MPTFLDLAAQRELRSSIKGARGGLDHAEIVLVAILCFGVLSACTFLYARGICRLLFQCLCDFVMELKYMSEVCIKPSEASTLGPACPPASRPEIQPPPPSFVSRQPRFPGKVKSYTNWGPAHPLGPDDVVDKVFKRQPRALQQNGPVAVQSCSRLPHCADERPPSSFEAVTSKSGLLMTKKVPRNRSAEIAAEDVPRLLGRERTLAIPWDVLEGKKKNRQYQKESSYGSSLCKSSSKVVTSESRLKMSSMASPTNVPEVSQADMPPLFRKVWSAPVDPRDVSQRIPRRSGQDRVSWVRPFPRKW